MIAAFVNMPDEFTVFATQKDPTSLAVTQLCSTRSIPCGATFFANQGQQQPISMWDSLLPPDDWRWLIGAEDHCQRFMSPMLLPAFYPFCHMIRRCNWVRFLTATDDKKSANLILLRQNPPTFQTTQQISAGEVVRLHVGHPLASEGSTSPIGKAGGCSFPQKESGNLDSLLHSTLERLIISDSPKCFTVSEHASDSAGSTLLRDRKHLHCSFCPAKFDRPSLLQRHERKHTGEKPFHCDFSDCRKSFSTSSSLNTHKRTHTGEKPHGCLECGKKFTASSNLYYHRFTHRDPKDRPHKCDFCHKGFTTPGDLTNHIHTHNNSWPHKCDICGKGYSKINQLKAHQRTHKHI